jgi:SAM-dependent methyltransferase
MSTSTEKGVWASGRAYEPYVGRWSRLVAREFVEWLAVPPAARWLDVGCGTGALTETILHRASPSEVHGIDPSEGYLALEREQVRDPRARFDVGDARHLSVESARYDAVVSALVLNFIPDLPAGMAQMAGAVRPDGIVAGYVWDYAGKMELMRTGSGEQDLGPGLARTQWMNLCDGYRSALQISLQNIEPHSVELILPHRFDRCVEPLSRVLDIGLIRNHDWFDVGAQPFSKGSLVRGDGGR